MNSWENFKAKKMGEEHYAVQDSGAAHLCIFQEENISLSEFHQSTHRTIKKEHVNFPSMRAAWPTPEYRQLSTV